MGTGRVSYYNDMIQSTCRAALLLGAVALHWWSLLLCNVQRCKKEKYKKSQPQPTTSRTDKRWLLRDDEGGEDGLLFSSKGQFRCAVCVCCSCCQPPSHKEAECVAFVSVCLVCASHVLYACSESSCSVDMCFVAASRATIRWLRRQRNQRQNGNSRYVVIWLPFCTTVAPYRTTPKGSGRADTLHIFARINFLLSSARTRRHQMSMAYEISVIRRIVSMRLSIRLFLCWVFAENHTSLLKSYSN